MCCRGAGSCSTFSTRLLWLGFQSFFSSFCGCASQSGQKSRHPYLSLGWALPVGHWLFVLVSLLWHQNLLFSTTFVLDKSCYFDKEPCLWLLTHMRDANRSFLIWLFSCEENEYGVLWINWRCLGACLTWAPRLHLKRFNVQPKRILIMNKS